MPVNAYAQKPGALLCAVCDPDFGPSFYSPYAAAAQTALLLMDDARRRLHRHTGKDFVRMFNYRLKSPASIREKLLRKGLPVSPLSAVAALRDVAGLRAVLASEESVYRFAELISRSPSCEITGIHDYIAAPKPSGYQSLHLLVRIPVSVRGQMLMVPAEIQLRTVSMDIWACAEHAVCYKPSFRAPHDAPSAR